MLLLNDIEYHHLLYNTFGPVSLSIVKNNLTKIQTNNGTGKTILLKTIIGMMIPTNGTIIKTSDIKTHINNIYNSTRLSNSQSKKLTMSKFIFFKKNIYLFDEPYSFLDIASISFFKKKMITLINKKSTVVITDCIKKSLLPTMIFYYGLKWL